MIEFSAKRMRSFWKLIKSPTGYLSSFSVSEASSSARLWIC